MLLPFSPCAGCPEKFRKRGKRWRSCSSTLRFSLDSRSSWRRFSTLDPGAVVLEEVIAGVVGAARMLELTLTLALLDVAEPGACMAWRWACATATCLAPRLLLCPDTPPVAAAAAG